MVFGRNFVRQLTFYLANQRYIVKKNIFEYMVKLSLHSDHDVKGENQKEMLTCVTNICLFSKCSMFYRFITMCIMLYPVYYSMY